MKKLDEITIADLMPDSLSRDAQVSATARAIDPQLRLVSEALGKPLILYSIDDLNEGVLEHLAVQYDVTAWDSAWPIDRKRAVLKTAIADKRKMGTRGAVQRAIEAIAPVATITEWWEANPPETPHTFRIDVLQDSSSVDAETQADVIAQVNAAKPVRSHFTFNVGQMLGGDLYFAGVLRAIAYARVRDSGIVTEQMGIQTGVLAALRGMSIRHILAETEMGDLPWSSLDFLLVNGESGKITRGANIFDIARAKTGQFTVDAAGDIVWVEGIPEYEEIVLYMPGGSGVTYESQYGVTSGYTGDPNSRYLYPLYSDPECTIPASYDATKRYEAGYYHYQTGEWTVKPIQTVTDMPSSTVSQFSDKTTAEILHNDNGVVKLWAIHNYASSYPLYTFSYGSNPVSFRFRLYDAPEPVVLPEVTISNKWLVLGADAGSTSGSNVTISANATRAGCWWDDGSGSYIASVYDSSVVYAVVRAAKTPWAVVARVGLPVENIGGAIGVRNSTGASITVYQAEYAYCDNLSATVVPVYDANNIAYNAFKFTANNTDYYYVLDGTQTDWTDNLAGIGYSLTQNYLKGYINTSKTNAWLPYGSSSRLYDESGNLIIGYGGTTYTLMGVYDASGNSVPYTNVSFYAYSNRLYFDWNDTTGAYVAYVEYTVS